MFICSPSVVESKHTRRKFMFQQTKHIVLVPSETLGCKMNL
nr:MAG TPA: hypothetical protein [Caudoviricetes sp.]